MNLVIPAPAPVVLPVVGGGGFPVRRVFCVGRNHAAHAKEMGATGREPPFFFMKPADALLPVGEGETGVVDYPPLTADLHHEVELVVALGAGGRDIAVDDAARCVWGCAVGLDMTRRDRQDEMKRQGRPWEIGKAFDQSAPIGPLLACGVGAAPGRGAITLTVDGRLRQRGDLADLIWSVPETIAQLSRGWRLQPGDLIFTGTPAGVGAVVPGQTMDAAIEGLPSLRVTVR